MKKTFPLPLLINCEGLTEKLIADLADRLCLHFEDVEIQGSDLQAGKPLSMNHYDVAWKILDRFAVKVS